ncbi:MAG: CopG family transcriptional regulator [Acidobacteria bacterium]|nr:CopG family transcriptional regulator [Acidobacteriota bacterium]
MRTTLNLSAEALAKVRQLARQRQKTLGAIASELILRALEHGEAPAVRNGVPVFAAEPDVIDEGAPPGLELVNRLRDQEP